MIAIDSGAVRVTVLGSSGTYPGPSNPGASLLIEAGGMHLVSDMGPGAFGALVGLIDVAEIDGVFISHQHPDHCSDVFALFHACAYGPDPIEGLPLYAPRPVIDRVAAFLGASTGHALFEVFDIVAAEPGASVTVGDVEVGFVEMDHSVPTVGSLYRHGGSALFYTADTGPGGDWFEQVSAPDLLICEATFGADADTGGYTQHLTAAQAGDLADRMDAARLMLTHIPPYLDPVESIREAESTFGKTVLAAVPGSTYEV